MLEVVVKRLTRNAAVRQGKHAPPLPKGLKSVGLKATLLPPSLPLLLLEENCQPSCLCWLLSLTWLQINGKTQQSTGSAVEAAAASWGILIFHTFPRRVLPRGVAAATSTAAATWQHCHFAWQKVFPAPWELHEYQISRQSVNFKAHAALQVASCKRPVNSQKTRRHSIVLRIWCMSSQLFGKLPDNCFVSVFVINWTSLSIIELYISYI